VFGVNMEQSGLTKFYENLHRNRDKIPYGEFQELENYFRRRFEIKKD